MTYAFMQDVPATESMYRQVRARLGDEPPKGLIVHIVMKQQRGLRYIDVWATEADWERFRDERLEGVVSEVLAEHGIPHDHSLVRSEGIDIIDAWIGESPTPA